MKKEKFCVLGDGAWGCAVASVLSRNGHDVTVWGRQPERMEEMNRTHENSRFLPGVTLPESIVFTADTESACRDAVCVILASPSQYMRGTLERFKPFFIPERHLLVNISKGIENKTLLRMSELCSEVLGKNQYCVLSGPSHAEEAARMIPT